MQRNKHGIPVHRPRPKPSPQPPSEKPKKPKVEKPKVLQLFTDASFFHADLYARDIRAGAGWVLLDPNGQEIPSSSKLEAHRVQMANDAEFMAVFTAVKWLVQQGQFLTDPVLESLSKYKLQIYCDNLRVVQYLQQRNSYQKGHRLYCMSNELYNLLRRFGGWSITWVKGHAGNHYNEYADGLAKSQTMKGGRA